MKTIGETVCDPVWSLGNYTVQNSILKMISESDSVCYHTSNFVRTFVWRPIANCIQISIRNPVKSQSEETIMLVS